MASFVEQVTSLIGTLENAKADAEKVDAGQKAAKARLRKALQEVRIACADMRKAVTAHGAASE